jgi:uracil-DNA glycosylase
MALCPALRTLWEFIQAQIFTIPSAPGPIYPIFNLYHDSLPGVDSLEGPQIRRENLYHYLESFPRKPTALVLGEAPGWRGCRFTGVPFTSEAMLLSGELPFTGKPSSLRLPPHTETSAKIFWQVMRPYHPGFLAWNCLAVHPHQPGKPLSNRHPGRHEIRAHLGVLSELIRLLMPVQLIAVGKSAQYALAVLDLPARPVRHPSHGGAGQFRAGIQAALS